MEKTLKVLNELEKEKLIEKYALGGGIAVLFYIEPVLTYDLDVFILIPASTGGLIVLAPLYDYLRKKGYRPHKEHIIIEGITVQLIPAYNELIKEAVDEAAAIKYKRTKTRVLRAEHLLAIMLQTYRPKDKARMAQMLEEAKLDKGYLEKILKRHNLFRKWQEFKKTIL